MNEMNTCRHSLARIHGNKPTFLPLLRQKSATSLRVALLALVLWLLLPLCTCTANAQGTLTNGWTHTGTISPVGDSDSWTFTASSGDTIVIRVGEISQVNSFTPRIRLQNPSAVQIALAQGAVAAEIVVTATNSGTFTVIVDDAFGTSATGTYRLTLAKSPGQVFVAPGDEGGPMTNGVMHTGTIDVGDLDVWTFNATNGDDIVVRLGEISDTNTFTPWIRLYSPDGKLLGSGLGAAVGEVEVTATNTGQFIVVVGDGNGSFSGSGLYRLTLAKTGDAVVVSAGDEGGPMTNGVMHLGTISTGDLDVWTFNANSGDAIVVRIGEITDTNTFTPWIRLYGPNGKLLDSGFGALAGEVEVTATNTGTFIIVASDGNGTRSGSGDYRLTLAKTGDPVVTSAGDNGGPMTNGVMHLGTISTGDLDLWTVNANSGDSIVVRIGKITDINTFTPWIRLYGPNGKLLDSGFGSLAGEVAVTATNSGTFIIVASDGNGTRSGSGDYRLTLVKTGDPILISAGDDGGPMTNGVMHLGIVLTGDLDPWTFNATSGDSIVVRIGKITDTNTFAPWIRLFGPNGKLLGSALGASAAEVAVTATNTGTFIVLATDGNGTISGSGDYRLTLVKTGEPVVISPADNGGPLTNGLMHLGTISTGDLDPWTFNAASGDAIILRIGEITDTNTFAPWIRLYGPDGKLLGSSLGALAAEVAVTATNSGTFLVLASDGNGAINGSGDYRLTLAKPNDPFFVSPGDEGGPLTGAGLYNGTISVGDLDLWSFTACAGDTLSVQMDESTAAGPLSPWIRLYGRDGTLLNSVLDASSALITRTALASGHYVIVLSDGNVGAGGSGDYTLTVNGLADAARLCTPAISGTNIVLSGIGGTPASNFVVFTHTNVATALSLWMPVLTNQFDHFGTFSVSNLYDSAIPKQFYRLQLP